MFGITSGVDLVEIKRFSSQDEAIKIRFLARVFTPRELDESLERDDSLAGLFAAKEAAAKALGCGIGDVRWQDIEILADQFGKPGLHLHGKAQEIAGRQGWASWSVSISHSAEYAVAMVTALYEQSGGE